MSFIPTGYQPQVAEQTSSGGSNYLNRLNDGETVIRFLTEATIFWQGWKDNKPVRFPYNQKPANPLELVDPPKYQNQKPLTEVWSAAIYNYTEGKIQLWNIDKKMIKDKLIELANDEDWGDPRNYTIKVVKSGTGLETQYTVLPKAPKPLEEAVAREFELAQIDMSQLFVPGGNPFGAAGNG